MVHPSETCNESNKHRVGNNYFQHEKKYNFNRSLFPTPWCEAKIFEKNNQSVSVNIFGIEKILKSPSYTPTYHIYPLKVVNHEKAEHFDIIFFTEGEKGHYIYIYKNFHD